MPDVIIKYDDFNCTRCNGRGIVFDGKELIKCLACKGLGLRINVGDDHGQSDTTKHSK